MESRHPKNQCVLYRLRVVTSHLTEGERQQSRVLAKEGLNSMQGLSVLLVGLGIGWLWGLTETSVASVVFGWL